MNLFSKHINTQLILTFVILLIVALQACEKNNEIIDPEYLVESELIVKLNSGEISELAKTYDDVSSFASMFIRYNVNIFKIIYKTIDTNNNPVLASGAIVIPDNKNPAPMISFQHGTIKNDKSAPSYFSLDDHFIFVVFSSSGYIIVLPDYLGYGSSNHLSHPYEHGRSLATASRDMLRAVREFDKLEKKFQANEKLFLTGYSEGGYATMALFKLLEEQHADEFKATAVTTGAGAYNKSLFAKHILETSTELNFLNEFLWVLDTYNKLYKLNRPYNLFFNEPYAGIISNGGVFANNQLNPGLLFNNNFREGIINGTDTQFLNVLTDNDNYDWEPQAPLQMYHGTNDDYVFYFNSSSAFEAMTNRGSKSVELKTVQGGDHFNSIQPYIMGTYLFFNKY